MTNNILGILFCAALFLLTIFLSCKEDVANPNETELITDFKLNPSRLNLSQGDEYDLILTIQPDSIIIDEVHWYSSNPEVVDVDDNGHILTKSVGSAVITVETSDGKYSATCNVRVSDFEIFEESFEDFANPERGFYKYTSTSSSNYSPLNESVLKDYRNGITYGKAKMPVTLIFRYFILSDFVSSPLSDEFISNVENDFTIARNAGVKLIPRFTYTNTTQSGDCRENWICPPYGDADLNIVLEHISQLGPILSANSDVILAVQMGFIGVWGENYYTDHFGDASSNGGVGKLLDQNWRDRIEVLEALLAELPDDMMVQVRYPQMKQRAVYGINANTSAAPLNALEAFNGDLKSRVGFHNDCLFASSDDFGTYADYGNSSTSLKTDITNLKPYFKEDGKYVLVGGETCSDGYSPQNDCSPVGMADLDLRNLHYTYLNSDYNNDVNRDWIDGGCMEDIKRNLGYRIKLDSAKVPSTVTVSAELKVEFHFTNIGYTAPMKPRKVYMVLRNDEATYKYELQTDIRFWAESVGVVQNIRIDAQVRKGLYDILVYFPDSNEVISDRPEYGIRLANDFWEANTGMNNTGMKIEIK